MTNLHPIERNPVSCYVPLYAYLARIYDPFATRVSSAARSEAIRQLRRSLRGVTPNVSGAGNVSGAANGERILVAGCGTGLSLPAILRMSTVEWVEAVDASPAMLRRAKHRATGPGRPPEARIAYRREDIRQLSYPDRTFDAAISLYVLDILCERDRRRALHSIARVLRPGGTFITATVARPERFVEYSWAVASTAIPALLGGSRPTDLRPELERAGFTVEASTRQTEYGLASHVLHSKVPE